MSASGARVGNVDLRAAVCSDMSDSRDWTRVKDVEKWSPMLEYEDWTVEERALREAVCAAW